MKSPIGPKSLSLNFPNLSRSFDATRNTVRFWGYDRAIEISFIVEAGALLTLRPEMSGTEAGILKAFDAARERVHEVADKVYARGQKGSYAYVLGANDFWSAFGVKS